MKNTKTTGETLPFEDVELEKSLLGHVLDSGKLENEILETLSADDFSDLANRKIYKTAVDLFSRGRKPGLTAIADYLNKEGELSSVGGVSYLYKLIGAKLPGSTCEHSADMIRRQGIRRRFTEYAQSILAMTKSGIPVEVLVDEGERLFRGVSMKAAGNTAAKVDQVFDSVLKNLKAKQGKEGLSGISSGYVEYDEMTGGLQDSDLIILAARPGMGKTAMALNLLLNAAVGGHAGAIFSLEMNRDQLVERFISVIARIGLSRIRKAQLTEYHMADMERCRDLFEKLPIYIDDTPGLSSVDFRAKSRQMKQEYGVSLIVVDYLQLMRSPMSSQGRQNEVADISRTMKEVAKELNLPVLALSQLNRKVQDRDDKRPMTSDLRESGAIEQDADLILFLYRDQVYNKSPENPLRDIAELIIGKHRNGPCGTVFLAFVEQFTMFSNAAINTEEVS